MKQKRKLQQVLIQRITKTFWLFCAFNLLPCNANADESIVLRELKVVTTSKLKFDDFVIQTVKGEKVYWDQVVSGKLSGTRQQQFDQLLETVGRPLFRMRHRLDLGDFESLKTIPETFFSNLNDSPTNQSNARHKFIVAMSCYFGRLASGQRAQSTLPLFQACKLLRKFPQLRNVLDESVLEPIDARNGFAENLVPIWFDKAAVKQTLFQIPNSNVSKLTDGQLIYECSMAVTMLESPDDHLQALAQRKSDIAQTSFLIIKTLQNSKPETAQLLSKYRDLSGSMRAAANFALGNRQSIRNDEIDDAVLDLLYIPANYSRQLPELSAAALYRAQEILKKENRFDEAQIVQSKLLADYKNTYHGRLGLKPTKVK